MLELFEALLARHGHEVGRVNVVDWEVAVGGRARDLLAGIVAESAGDHEGRHRSHAEPRARHEPRVRGEVGCLATVAAENGFDLHNALLSRWVKRFGAEVVGTIDLVASNVGDLVADRSQTERLEAFAGEILGKSF